MRISAMIAQLQTQLDQLGDVEVLITDGYACTCYRGEYAISAWEDDNGKMSVDIGIGGCNE
jgi:hypothetical protein